MQITSNESNIKISPTISNENTVNHQQNANTVNNEIKQTAKQNKLPEIQEDVDTNEVINEQAIKQGIKKKLETTMKDQRIEQMNLTLLQSILIFFRSLFGNRAKIMKEYKEQNYNERIARGIEKYPEAPSDDIEKVYTQYLRNAKISKNEFKGKANMNSRMIKRNEQRNIKREDKQDEELDKIETLSSSLTEIQVKNDKINSILKDKKFSENSELIKINKKIQDMFDFLSKQTVKKNKSQQPSLESYRMALEEALNDKKNGLIVLIEKKQELCDNLIEAYDVQVKENDDIEQDYNTQTENEETQEENGIEDNSNIEEQENEDILNTAFIAKRHQEFNDMSQQSLLTNLDSANNYKSQSKWQSGIFG